MVLKEEIVELSLVRATTGRTGGMFQKGKSECKTSLWFLPSLLHPLPGGPFQVTEHSPLLELLLCH